jgi:hypothetical protein
MMVLFGAMQAGKVVALREQTALLLDLRVSLDPRLRLVVAALWMFVFWGLAIALWRKAAVTRWLVPLLLAVHALYELVVLGIFAQVPVSEQRWIQDRLFSVLLILLSYWALNRGASRPYFSEEDPAGS